MIHMYTTKGIKIKKFGFQQQSEYYGWIYKLNATNAFISFIVY